MEYNKNIDLQVALDYVKEEIKEKSKIWATKLVDKKHIEDVVLKEFEPTKKEQDNYDVVAEKIRGKDPKKIEYLIKSFSDEEKKDYEKIAGRKADIEKLEIAIGDMEKLEKFLNIAVEIKEELNDKLK